MGIETKKVEVYFSADVGAPTLPEEKIMTKSDFLAMCSDFFDMGGTGFPNFSEMHIRIDACQ